MHESRNKNFIKSHLPWVKYFLIKTLKSSIWSKESCIGHIKLLVKWARFRVPCLPSETRRSSVKNKCRVITVKASDEAGCQRGTNYIYYIPEMVSVYLFIGWQLAHFPPCAGPFLASTKPNFRANFFRIFSLEHNKNNECKIRVGKPFKKE